MAESEQFYLSNESMQSGIDLKIVIRKLMLFWYVFAIFIVASLLSAWLYLRYQTPVYKSKAMVLIRDEKKGGAASEISAFQDLNILKGSNSLDNEIEIFRSRSLMMRSIKDLNLQITYYMKGNVISKEAYKTSPIRLTHVAPDSVRNVTSASFKIEILSSKEYRIAYKNSDKSKICKFDDTILTSKGPLTVILTDSDAESWKGKTIYVLITPLAQMVDRGLASLSVKPINKTSNVLELTVVDGSLQKATDLLNNLIQQHIQDAIEDKNLISENTASFINERLRYISEELSNVESSAQDYKQQNNLVDVESDAKMNMESDKLAEEKYAQANTQLKLADYMYQYLMQHNSVNDLLPSNLGIADPATTSHINSYNSFVLERNRMLKSSTEMNPMVENIDAQLSNLKQSLASSIANYKSSIQIQVRDISRQLGGINSRISSMPRFQRQIRSIERQQLIKEQLYLYLLQKREETNIALAVTIGNSKIIDPAYGNGIPISPNRKNIYLIALALGLFIPAGILYIRNLIDSKVHGLQDLEKLKMPYLGEIPMSGTEEVLVVTKGQSTPIAESFRLLRSNLEFMMSTQSEKCQVIFITSTVADEGKSFIALNLASTISLIGKRVLLMGLDLRAPKLLEYTNLESRQGISNYMVDDRIELQDIIIQRHKDDSFDILPSGDIPPNPAELLLMPRLGELFAELRLTYDYIVVDTAPVGMVSDTLLVKQFADTFVYVVRAHFLDKDLLHIPHSMYVEKRLPNLALLINGIDFRKGYGYGYGYHNTYGYGNMQRKPWWKRILK